jgi:hypothetical protein
VTDLTGRAVDERVVAENPGEQACRTGRGTTDLDLHTGCPGLVDEVAQRQRTGQVDPARTAEMHHDPGHLRVGCVDTLVAGTMKQTRQLAVVPRPVTPGALHDIFRQSL